MRGLILLSASLCFAVSSFAQTSAPVKVWTGNVGAGLALTSGNADTRNFNFSFAAIRDPKQKNILRLNGLYLWGNKDGVSIIDRTTIGVRDEVMLSPKVFFFVQNDYLHDKFKEIDYLISPTAGFGYKFFNTDKILLALDSALGLVWEKNTGQKVKTNGAYNGGERFSWKLSPTAAITQQFAGLWELDDFHDALYTLGLGLAASITSNSELKIELLDSYKTQPPDPLLKKNDVAIVTAFVLKF